MSGEMSPHRAAAVRLMRAHAGAAYRLEECHEYTDLQANALYWKIRARDGATGEKWVRPMKLASDGYRLGEPSWDSYPDGKPLYRLHELALRPTDPVIVTEGELKADKLAELGLLAVTSGGADSAANADWGPLTARQVIVWPDNDAAGHRYAAAVLKRLQSLHCDVRTIDTSMLDLPAKGDAVDWLAAHPTASASDVFALPVVLAMPQPTEGEQTAAEELTVEEARSADKSQSSVLVAFVQERATLFHDENKDVYAVDAHSKETRRLDSRQFRDWMVAEYYAQTAKSAREQSVREALATLAGMGRFHGERLPVYVRVAPFAGAYYLDLGEDGLSRAVRVHAGGWEVVSDPPVRFVRPETLQPLPEPDQNGSLEDLWPLLNVAENERLLIAAWLVECLRPETPFPVLELIGEQGSAKSTTQKVLRRLIDPNACDLRAAPKTPEDVFVSAGVNWLVSYENISHLSPPMQDALCVLATGGGFAKRKLYTDADESVINVKRPIVLNGIAAAVTAQDLIDRAVSIELPVIRNRLEVPDLWAAFDALRAKLLGGLLNTMSKALQILPEVSQAPDERPRLAEFARLGMAVAQALGYQRGDFLDSFNASRRECIARTIDASPAAAALMEWFDARDRVPATMSIKDLLHEVELKKPPNADAWPRSPKGFGDALRRAAPALRQLGIEVRSLGKTGGTVRWTVEPLENLRHSSPACPASPGQEVSQQAGQDIRTFRTFRTLDRRLLIQRADSPGCSDTGGQE